MPPDFTQTLRNKVLPLGEENFRYEVEFIGAPRPSLVWYHNGLVIKSTPDEQVKIESEPYRSTLTLKKVLKEDEGEYRARIFSFMGEAISIAEVKVVSGVEVVEDVKLEDEKIIKRVVKIKKPKMIEEEEMIKKEEIEEETMKPEEKSKKRKIKIFKKPGLQIETEQRTFTSADEYLEDQRLQQQEKLLIAEEKEEAKKRTIKIIKKVCTLKISKVNSYYQQIFS